MRRAIPSFSENRSKFQKKVGESGGRYAKNKEYGIQNLKFPVLRHRQFPGDNKLEKISEYSDNKSARAVYHAVSYKLIFKNELIHGGPV